MEKKTLQEHNIPFQAHISSGVSPLRFKVNVSSPLHQSQFFSLEPILLERTSFKAGRRKQGSDSVSKSIWMTEHRFSQSTQHLLFGVF